MLFLFIPRDIWPTDGHSSFPAQTLSHIQLLVTLWSGARQALCPWDFPGKNAGLGWHFLLQGIFLMEGSDPRMHLPHWQAGSLPLTPPLLFVASRFHIYMFFLSISFIINSLHKFYSWVSNSFIILYLENSHPNPTTASSVCQPQLMEGLSRLQTKAEEAGLWDGAGDLSKLHEEKVLGSSQYSDKSQTVRSYSYAGSRWCPFTPTKGQRRETHKRKVCEWTESGVRDGWGLLLTSEKDSTDFKQCFSFCSKSIFFFDVTKYSLVNQCLLLFLWLKQWRWFYPLYNCAVTSYFSVLSWSWPST